MPLIKNQLGKDATLRATANATLQLYDFSLPYDPQAGTVQLQGSNVIGTGTTLSTNFANGDFVHAVVNSTLSEARVVNQTVNATFMNVTASWTAANASTTFSKSERVDAVEISRATFTSNGYWTVARGANTVLILHGTQDFDFSGAGHSITEDGAATVVATHSSGAGGTLVLELSKRSTIANNQVNSG